MAVVGTNSLRENRPLPATVRFGDFGRFSPGIRAQQGIEW
jgi:hypothetical protein